MKTTIKRELLNEKIRQFYNLNKENKKEIEKIREALIGKSLINSFIHDCNLLGI